MSRSLKALISLGVFAAAAVAAYWAAWFLAPDLVQSRAPADADYALYVAYQQAFPLADSWLAAAGLLGALGLWRRRAWGGLFLLAAGGAAIFLGLMDLLYDLEHRMFTPVTGASLTELVIVVCLLALGPVTLALAWRTRGEWGRWP